MLDDALLMRKNLPVVSASAFMSSSDCVVAVFQFHACANVALLMVLLATAPVIEDSGTELLPASEVVAMTPLTLAVKMLVDVA